MKPTTYTAITIGPIYDTLTLTSTPARLWAASYLLSDLSRELCAAITGAGAELVAPIAGDSRVFGGLSMADGVGLYPDHIIFDPKASG